MEKNSQSKHAVQLIKDHGVCLVKGNFAQLKTKLDPIIFEACGAHINDMLHVDIIERDSLSVDDARAIKETAYKVTRVEGIMHTIIIAADTLTREAQNSLLKVFEEPIASAVIMLVTPHPERLLPTLLSRLVEIPTAAIADVLIDKKTEENILDSEISELASDFLSQSIPKRLTIVQDIAKKLEAGNWSKKDVAAFLIKLKKVVEKEKPEAIKELEMSHRFILDQSSSIKMLLEHVALTL